MAVDASQGVGKGLEVDLVCSVDRPVASIDSDSSKVSPAVAILFNDFEACGCRGHGLKLL